LIKSLLIQNEEKTLEFKENVRPMQSILRTAVAFANTAGGTLGYSVSGIVQKKLSGSRMLSIFLTSNLARKPTRKLSTSVQLPSSSPGSPAKSRPQHAGRWDFS